MPGMFSPLIHIFILHMRQLNFLRVIKRRLHHQIIQCAKKWFECNRLPLHTTACFASAWTTGGPLKVCRAKSHTGCPCSITPCSCVAENQTGCWYKTYLQVNSAASCVVDEFETDPGDALNEFSTKRGGVGAAVRSESVFVLNPVTP